MKRKAVRKFILVGSLFLLLLIGTYAVLQSYYKNNFAYGTWINGIYCTGKTVEEVNAELNEAFAYGGLTVRGQNGEELYIPAEDISFEYDYNDSLAWYLNSQNPKLWIDNLFEHQDRELRPGIRFDEEKLTAILDSTDWIYEEQKHAFLLKKTANGYSFDDTLHDQMDVERVAVAVKNSILEARPVLDLVSAGCYYDCTPDVTDQKMLSLWDLIKQYQAADIAIDFGCETVHLTGNERDNLLVVDEQKIPVLDEAGNLQTDEEKIDAFVENLGDRFDTKNSVRSFQTTSGRVVEVSGGTYGKAMDREKLKAYLKEAIADNRTETIRPEWDAEDFGEYGSDIGDTYIEVDMGEQHLYYYLKGELVLDTPVVTGNMSLGRDTPTGVNYVYLKQRKRVLRGPNYASPVDYWMPVNKGIGIHDSSWRSEYGGEIYKTAGSHGCINTPIEVVSQLYEMTEIGTPVVMFY